MFNFKLLLLATLLAIALAKPDISYKRSEEEEYGGSSSSYEFSYKVEDSEEDLDFGHSEKKEGDVVEGYYYAEMPEDSKTHVKYRIEDDDDDDYNRRK